MLILLICWRPVAARLMRLSVYAAQVVTQAQQFGAVQQALREARHPTVPLSFGMKLETPRFSSGGGQQRTACSS